LLEYYKSQNRLNELSKNIKELESIAQEAFSIDLEKKSTKKFLEKLINGNKEYKDLFENHIKHTLTLYFK
jgi:hypothetical protein